MKFYSLFVIVLVVIASAYGGDIHSDRMSRRRQRVDKSKSLKLAQKQIKQFAKPLYLTGQGVLISDTKYYFIKRTMKYIYTAVYSIKTVITGVDSVDISDLILDKTTSTFQFSEEDITSKFNGCDITSSIVYTYEQLSVSERCEAIKAFLRDFETSIFIPTKIENYDLKSSSQQIYTTVSINDEEQFNYKLKFGLTTYSVDFNKYNFYSFYLRYGEYRELELYTSNYKICHFIGERYFSYESYLIDYKHENNYTIGYGEWNPVYYFCIDEDCNYLFQSKDFTDEQYIDLVYLLPAAKKMSKEDALSRFWNDLERETESIIEAADKYVPENPNERMNDISNNRKLADGKKGYYYEDVKISASYEDKGYYNGYFIVKNMLIIIDQSIHTQYEYTQSNLVIEIPSSNEIKIESINDVDQDKSGVYTTDYSARKCDGFITVNNSTKCGIEDITSYFKAIGNTYKINGLKLEVITPESTKTFDLIETDETILNDIIPKITTKRLLIPEGKCIVNEYNLSYKDTTGIDGCYNNVFYYTAYREKESEAKRESFDFNYGSEYDKDVELIYYTFEGLEDGYYYGPYGNYYQYYLQPNQYVNCDEKIKIKVLDNVRNMVEKIKTTEPHKDYQPTTKPPETKPPLTKPPTTLSPTTQQPSPQQFVTISFTFSNITKEEISNTIDSVKEMIIDMYKNSGIVLNKDEIEITFVEMKLRIMDESDNIKLEVKILIPENKSKNDIISIIESKSSNEIKEELIKKNPIFEKANVIISIDGNNDSSTITINQLLLLLLLSVMMLI